MKRRVIIVLSSCALATMAYFTASKWLIRHQTLTFHDILRGNREVTVDIAVRRDREMEAMAEYDRIAGGDPQPWQHCQAH